MKAGVLDRRITIQRATIIQDTYGQNIETWSDVAILFAQVVPQRGDERFTAEQIIGKMITVFRIRYPAWITGSITVKDRISYEGKFWDIHATREIGRREGLEMDASTRSE